MPVVARKADSPAVVGRRAVAVAADNRVAVDHSAAVAVGRMAVAVVRHIALVGCNQAAGPEEAHHRADIAVTSKSCPFSMRLTAKTFLFNQKAADTSTTATHFLATGRHYMSIG
jgi:hypothetical protein